MRVAPFFGLMGVALAVPIFARASDCRDLAPPANASSRPTRPINAADLVGLRDIGPSENNAPRTGILSLSPDGTKVAFQLRRAEPLSNDYCLGMVILHLDQPGVPHFVDMGGEVILKTRSAMGFAVAVPSGTLLAITPKWSPDGQRIAYLRRESHSTQVWIADVNGGAGRQETHAAFDVEDFAWTADGASLIVSGRPGLIAAERSIEREGTSGFLYDDRFAPAASDRPLPREPVATEYFTLDLGSGDLRAASVAEQKRIDASPPDGLPPGSLWGIASPSGNTAWVQTDPNDASAPSVLRARMSGRDVPCVGDNCGQVLSLWWAGTGSTLIYLRRDGALGENYGIYRWRPGLGTPERIAVTTGIFEGCQPASGKLICGYETALQPREIVSVDLENGELKRLFDPNPEFADLRLGQVQRLTLTNAFGISTWADLVLPPAHKPGQKHPLIIVEYESRGFLRGGTGDEYPIQVYAAAGFAVLSFQRPPDFGWSAHPKTIADLAQQSRVNWADRRSVLALMEDGIQKASDLGVVERSNVGLTGLSDGASAVQFAVINSHAFKAFATSSCCDEESVVGFLGGPAGVALMHSGGYPLLNDDGDQFWKDDSIRVNAEKINRPILALNADREYLGALEGIMSLQQLGKPVEMYVFPDEYHIRWQPIHRLATYERTLDWFRFWLMAQEDPDPAKAEQYRRWQAMRSKLKGEQQVSEVAH